MADTVLGGGVSWGLILGADRPTVLVVLGGGGQYWGLIQYSGLISTRGGGGLLGYDTVYWGGGGGGEGVIQYSVGIRQGNSIN